MNSKKEMKTEQHAKYCTKCGKGLGANAQKCPSCGCDKLYTPTKVTVMSLSTEKEMVLNLLHLSKPKTMVMYRSKDGQHRVSAYRRSAKTWVVMDGKVVRTTQIRKLIQGIDWA